MELTTVELFERYLQYYSEWSDNEMFYVVSVTYVPHLKEIEVHVNMIDGSGEEYVGHPYQSQFHRLNCIPQFNRFCGRLREEVRTGYEICRLLYLKGVVE